MYFIILYSNDMLLRFRASFSCFFFNCNLFFFFDLFYFSLFWALYIFTNLYFYIVILFLFGKIFNFFTLFSNYLTLLFISNFALPVFIFFDFLIFIDLTPAGLNLFAFIKHLTSVHHLTVIEIA
jgi:hypothetical protein